MAFILFYGTMPMGRVEKLAGCSIATRFKVLNGIPVRPIDSFVEVHDPRWPRGIPIPLHRRSVRAGYLRVWLPLFALGAFVATALSPFAILGAIALAAASAHVWFAYGNLSRSERRKRFAYATWLGAPIDPGLLPAAIDLGSAQNQKKPKLHGRLRSLARYAPADGRMHAEVAGIAGEPSVVFVT